MLCCSQGAPRLSREASIGLFWLWGASPPNTLPEGNTLQRGKGRRWQRKGLAGIFFPMYLQDESSESADISLLWASVGLEGMEMYPDVSSFKQLATEAIS